MDFYNVKRQVGSLQRILPIRKCNKYYQSLSTDKPQIAQVSEDVSRASVCADIGLALDMSGDTAIFANRLMNENKNREVLNLLIILSKL